MAWQPIETAPKDGALLTLTWFENGKPQEVYPAMQWDDAKEIWVIRSLDGKLLMTWSDEGDGGPTHWRPFEDTAHGMN